jgi:hypothetical protein
MRTAGEDACAINQKRKTVSKMFDMALRIQNWATKYVDERTKAASKAHSDSLASAGFRLRQLTQQGMRAQAPGDVTWPAPHPWTQYGLLRKSTRAFARAQARGKSRRAVTRVSLTGDKKPLSRLASAVRYQKKIAAGPDGTVSQTTVRVGFLTSAAAERAAYHAEAHTVPVTLKMRRKIFAAGLVILAGTIKIPKREHVAAVYRKNHARIAGFCQQRINRAWAGQDPKGIAPPF